MQQYHRIGPHYNPDNGEHSCKVLYNIDSSNGVASKLKCNACPDMDITLSKYGEELWDLITLQQNMMKNIPVENHM